MWDFLKWFVVIEIIGWIIFPTAYTLFRGLKDRGFTVSKILGLLIWGYIYWIANISGIASNSYSSAVLILFIIFFASLIIHKNSFKEIFAFVKSNRFILIFYEIVFLFAFAFWAVIRSLSPEIIGTEKPMELAFINAIFRSPAFPPNDPWLSGYAISYYYFGYLFVALFMHVCGTVSGVAFNLAIALWFALIAVSSAGLLFNLIPTRNDEIKQKNRGLLILLSLSLLAPLMILIVSNAEGFLELLHAQGVSWEITPDGTVADSGFWQWLDIQELRQPPSQPFSWQPQRTGGTWWWRASRVLQDYDVIGNPREIINEFPFFSYHLADLHPHVISIPFTIMVLFWALTLLRSRDHFHFSRISLTNPAIWTTGFLCGSLIFINTWDFPIYAGFLVIIFGVKVFLTGADQKIPFKEMINFGISLGILSIVFYLPFILGLSSQVGGFLPSLVFRTRGIHFLVMFLPQIIFVSWLLIDNARESKFSSFNRFFFISILASICLFLLSILYAYVFSEIPGMIQLAGSFLSIETSSLVIHWQSRIQGFLSIFAGQDANQLIATSIQRLISDPSVILLLSSWLALSLAYMFWVKKDKSIGESAAKVSDEKTLVIVMVIIGLLLCLAPEFFYLRDQFGWRMNTIFKFYYQAWILLSMASSFFIIRKFMAVKTAADRVIFSVIMIIVFSICLVYPFFALKDRINSLSNKPISLDGNAYLEDFYPEEYQAVMFLKDVPYGVITEAVGGSYSNFGRISRLTGLPTVLGWPGHEVQWRGGAEEIGSRESDINTLYSTDNWDEAQNVIDQYEIDYIYIGPLERSTYAIAEDKFFRHLSLIYENSEIRIYSINR